MRYDLGMDSLDEYELLYKLGEEFGIDIPEDAMGGYEGPKTVKNIMLIVGEYMKAARSARQ